MRGAVEPRRRVRVAPAASSTGPSARSRPCSTCWPTPSCSWRVRAAWPCMPPGRSTPWSPTTPWPPPPWPRPTAPGRRGRCARPPSRCTEASATPGSAWPTSILRRALLSTEVLGGVGASLDRVVAHHGIGGRSWTSVTLPTRPGSASGSGPGSTCTTRASRHRRPTTSTGPARRPGTGRSTTAASSASPGRASIGGQGLPSVYDVIVDDELAAAGAPPRPSLGYLVEGILEHADDDVQARFLPGIVNGRDRWCQGFSEPDAGSDLASLRTRADRDGDEYVITGHKVWTSYSDDAEWCLVLARTDHEVARHKGISAFALPMRQPGVEQRPAAHDQRDHQGVRRGDLRRRPGAGGQHDRPAGGGVAAGHDHREPRAGAARAGVRRSLRQAGEGPRGPGAGRPRGVRRRAGPRSGLGYRRIGDVAAARPPAALRPSRRDRARTGGIGGQVAHDLDGTGGGPCRTLDRRRPGHRARRHPG